MNSGDKYIQDISVLGLEKIKKEVSGKRYEFVLQVKWSNGSEATIYRPHSMFFDFQSVLAEMFKDVKIPNAPAVKFHWLLLGKLGHERECKVMEEFCKKIIRLPPNVSKADIVLHFFESWGTDLRTKQKASSELFDPEVGRASIQSTQERSKTGMTGIEKEDQYRVIANYEATNIGEMSLIEGALVTIIEKNERGWWFVADDNGKQGWAPATYLEPQVTNTNDETGYDWVSVTDKNGVGEKYVSMVSYKAENSDELSYVAGEEIEALEKSSYGWWKVRIKGKIGITPATNLQKVDDTTIYQSANELKTRTVSISSGTGLYAVIRKPPPRRESVRSRSSSGYSNSLPPTDQNLTIGLSGKKPSRFVYSAASFSGGKFVIGEEEENKGNNSLEPPVVESNSSISRDIKKSESLKMRDNYENIDRPKTENGLRNKSADPEKNPQSTVPSSYVNIQRSKDADAEFYVTLYDYNPGGQRKEDLPLSKGDIVQLISSDSGWMFVALVKGDMDQQGWVPETYLQKKHDVTSDVVLTGKGSPKPKPRPRPAPRPRTKPQDQQQQQASISTPEITRRPQAPQVGVNSQLKALRNIHENKENTQPPVTMPSEEVYDEPEMPLRSVYDSELWYFGNISRAECERCLEKYGRQQEFLIRDSQRAKGSYALSVKYCYRIRHFPIEANDDGKLLIGKLTFPNLMEIVDYYQKNPLFYSEHKEPITLGKPFTKEKSQMK